MNLSFKILLSTLVTILFACSSKGSEYAAQSAQPEPASAPQQSVELPLPHVPVDMRDPAERAEFILTHFWDEMDFSDTIRSHNRLFLEQNFVNFIGLFEHAPQKSLPDITADLLNKASIDRESLYIIADIAEQYWNDPNSPMRSEDYYIIFLEQYLSLPSLTDIERERPVFQLEMARKNRPGMTATDFKYLDRNGHTTSLLKTKGSKILLIFYSPDCSHCSEILKSLQQDPILQQCLDDQSIKVVAVYTEGDNELWNKTKSDMPADWIVGIDQSSIVDKELYDIPAMPILYLLDNNKKILLKDPSPASLIEYLATEKANIR